MKLKNSYIILPVIMMLLTLLFCNNSGTELTEHEEKVHVKIENVIQKEISIPVRSSGRLASKAETKLSFKVGGIIQSLPADEGQQVTKGQLLAKLDQKEIQAKVQQAQSAFEKSERDLERAKKLYADSVATLEQLQDATTGRDIARSNLQIAEFNLRHSAIHAPSDGKILKRFAEANELTAAGTPVFIFGSTARDWVVRVGVSDHDIMQIQLMDSATVTFDAYPGIVFSASVSEVAEAADPMSGTFEVELNLNEHNYALKSGFFARVKIHTARKEKAALIPVAAFTEGEGKTGFVFVPSNDNSRAKKIPVKIKSIYDKYVLVSEGLEKIDRVITDGSPYLSDETVIVINE